MMTASAHFLVAVVLAAAVPAPPAKPPPAPPEELTYTVPPGWERAEKERIVILTPPGTTADQCSLVVTPGETLEGEFPEWFKDRWEALRKGATVVQGGGRTGKNGPNGSSFLFQAGLLEAAGEGGVKQRMGLLLYAVHIGDAVHGVVFRTDGAALFNEHKKTVNAFLAGLKFAHTEREKEPAKRKKPAPPVKPRRAAAGSQS